MIIAPSLITDSTSLADLMLLDLSEDKNFCTAKSIKLNFSTRQALRDAEVSEQSEIAFRCDVKTCLQSFLEKLKERSNLKHKLVSNLDCMNPMTIERRSVGTVAKKLGGCLTELSKNKTLSPDECNLVETEYRKMVLEAKGKHQDKFQ